MPESLEDRIFAAGKNDEFDAAVEKFRSSKKTRDDEQDLYEKLEALGASPEETDEFVNMEVENG